MAHVTFRKGEYQNIFIDVAGQKVEVRVYMEGIKRLAERAVRNKNGQAKAGMVVAKVVKAR